MKEEYTESMTHWNRQTGTSTRIAIELLKNHKRNLKLVYVLTENCIDNLIDKIISLLDVSDIHNKEYYKDRNVWKDENKCGVKFVVYDPLKSMDSEKDINHEVYKEIYCDFGFYDPYLQDMFSKASELVSDGIITITHMDGGDIKYFGGISFEIVDPILRTAVIKHFNPKNSSTIETDCKNFKYVMDIIKFLHSPIILLDPKLTVLDIEPKNKEIYFIKMSGTPERYIFIKCNKKVITRAGKCAVRVLNSSGEEEVIFLDPESDEYIIHKKYLK